MNDENCQTLLKKFEKKACLTKENFEHITFSKWQDTKILCSQKYILEHNIFGGHLLSLLSKFF